MPTATKNDLQTRIEELEAQLAVAEEELSYSQTRIEDLKGKLERLERQANYMREENSRFKAVLSQTQRLLATSLEDLSRRLR
jgi:peptidoglycan hydrolase CwlO-like protein